MKKFYMVLGTALASILSTTSGHAQWSFTAADQADTISFDEVVPGVVNDFNGAGFTPTPTLGQLDSDAWRASGFSSSSSFGDTQTSGDFARGASAGSVGSGGIYGFEVAAGDTALGIQPGGSDFTPGDLDLLVINNTGGNVDTVSVSYELWVYNDQPRSNTYNFSYLVGSTSGTYTAVPALSDTTIEVASGSPSWTSTVLSADIPVALADGDSLVLRWTGDDYQGGSSRDEVAFDDIIVALSSGAAPTPLADSLVITEIMYNLPGNDSVEFIEMQNIGSTPIDLTGFSFTEGVVYNFPSITVNAGDYFLVTNDSVEFLSTYGFSAYEWTSGGLSNSGEDITIVNASNATVDSVDYDDVAPWPTEADGLGWSLTLTNSALDNNDAANWCLSGNMVSGYIINGIQMYSSPGASDICYVAPINLPTYTISEINNVDPTTGAADSLGVTCWTKGVVLGVDMDGNNGISFTIWDNEGINIYNANDVSNYVVNEGDSIILRGTVGQYNGLTQFSPDSIQLVNTGNVIPTPTVVTDLDESTESELVRFDDALVTSINGSNYTLVSGNDTIVMRVDNDTDVDDSLTFVVGDSLCFVIGIGGQFDNSNPYTSGYQVFPRYYTDIDTTCGGFVAPPAIPTYTIAEINNVDPTTGVADSNGITCWTKGVVMGVNMNGNGLSFTIWDNEGIGVYNGSGNLGYTVTEGDSVVIRGTVGQYNGLTQISPDSIQLVNTGNVIPTPTVVTDLDESTESELVRFDDVLVTSISGSNYTLVSGNDTIVMRVDSDTDVDDSLTFVVGDSLCYVIGIGGQFDNSNPYTSGYQMFPRYYTDIDTACGASVTPPAVPTYPIADINNVDVDGVADSLGITCWTKGVVLGVDMDGNAGLSFTIWDGEGINIYNPADVSAYVVTEGDSILVRGTIDQYNGLTELIPDSIQLLNTGNVIPTPTVVTTLSESTESELIRIENVLVAGINPTGGSGTNYDLVMGTDTLTMRVDNDTDVDDSLTFVVGDSLCYIIGIGGQFDGTNPYTSGYQIFPRYYTDIDTTCGGSITPPVTPEYEIADINNVDVDGVADSNGVYCWTEGVVLGVNMRPAGLQFTIWDMEGIGVFNNTGDLGYTVAEGDLIRIKGTVSQFNGLTQMNPDEIVLVSSNNTIPVPEVVSTLSEDTESELVRVNSLMVASIDSSSSAINYALVSGADTITMRVDLDTDVEDNWSLAINDSLCYVIGIGGQFDNSSPYTSGYQLFPRTAADLDTASCIVNSVNVLSAKEGFAVYPNPVSGSELFFNQVADVVVYNTTGSIVMNAKQVNRIAVDQLKAGVYIIRTANAEVVRVVVR